MYDSHTAVSVIVPAYREEPNIEPLVRGVFEATGKAGLDAEMIVVDDDSQDGTVETVERLGAEFHVRVSVRTGERGLATAVLRGFAEAANDIFVVMDADLQHPPERIGDLVRPIARGETDFVSGSRYVRGGRIDERWSAWRRINSWGATMLARPLVRLSDPMSGFFALHRDTWRRADPLNPVGYKIGLELVVKGRVRRIVEVPITFSRRHAGASKLSLRERGRYLRHLGQLYRYRFGRHGRARVAVSRDLK